MQGQDQTIYTPGQDLKISLAFSFGRLGRHDAEALQPRQHQPCLELLCRLRMFSPIGLGLGRDSVATQCQPLVSRRSVVSPVIRSHGLASLVARCHTRLCTSKKQPVRTRLMSPSWRPLDFEPARASELLSERLSNHSGRVLGQWCPSVSMSQARAFRTRLASSAQRARLPSFA